jgi:hypothetical protein
MLEFFFVQPSDPGPGGYSSVSFLCTALRSLRRARRTEYSISWREKPKTAQSPAVTGTAAHCRGFGFFRLNSEIPKNGKFGWPRLADHSMISLRPAFLFEMRTPQYQSETKSTNLIFSAGRCPHDARGLVLLAQLYSCSSATREPDIPGSTLKQYHHFCLCTPLPTHLVDCDLVSCSCSR